MQRTPSFLRGLATLGAAALLAGSAQATWSIVCVNVRTGEVGVASATCILGEDLRQFVPVVVVGKGAGAAQSLVDGPARNKKIMFRDFQLGFSSEQIFEDLVTNGPPGLQTRQFGIVSLIGDPVTFTGTGAGQAAGGVTGRIGDIKYSIQGNVLTGDVVWLEAERAFRAVNGDMSQRLIAAMDAARLQGGDGRCSCSGVNPTGCGAPPPSFKKSAHTAFVIVARPGDLDGVCTPALGCANGSYYLNVSRQTQARGPDPVIRLLHRYENWRDSMKGRPDHFLSRVVQSATSAPADGLTRVDFVLRLVDLEGVPLTSGGAGVTVTARSGRVTLSAVRDNGDGSYAFSATAGTAVGLETLDVVVDDGQGAVTILPAPTLRLDPVAPLHVGLARLSAGAGGSVPFVIQEPSRGDDPYVLLGTASGTVPGQRFGNLLVPLNDDALFMATLAGAGGPLLPGSFGLLDGAGRAEASLVAPPGLLLSLVDARLEWATVFLGARPSVSNVVGFDLDL